ncbi:MAG TPA: lysophospholipid acyltransferase family protein [Ferruginibacter sp.]|nr:lysophospholipid acyltransferase family protein [Ferruginibacter sp.]
MYYIVFPLLYVISLIPFFILYPISDGIAFLLYHVFKYRRDVVYKNLQIAFPEKTVKEHKAIAKRFYQNLTDTFLEIIKLISISDKTLAKRCGGDFSMIDELAKKGKNIQIHAGHQFNWEYGSLFMSGSIKTIATYAIYTPINSKPLERLFLKIRQRYGTRFIKSTEFKTKKDQIFKERFVFFLAADQVPGNAAGGYWQNYFGKPAPFITGPEISGIKNNTAIVFARSRIVKRGHYVCECSLFAENGASTETGEITRAFRDFLEKVVREEPHNYLWTHRRWKLEYKPEFKNKWIDDKTNAPG